MPKKWQVIEVAADMFEGIVASYSGDTIGDGKTIRRPFKYRGGFYVAVGGFWPGEGSGKARHEEAYQIVPGDQFKGEATWYGEKLSDPNLHDGEYYDWAGQRRSLPEGFYHGMFIKRGTAIWVLVGPPLVFTLGLDSTKTKQLTLF